MDTLRRFLSSNQAPGPRRDPEHGYTPEADNGSTAIPSRTLTVKTIDQNALIPHEDKLLIFRTLTGIDTVPIVTNRGHEIRSAPNLGIYNRVVANERSTKSTYKRLNILTKAFYCLQVVIGAALTALSASRGSYRALTGLAVLNTILAGLVTYFKASDIPDKYKQDEAEWRKIREYVEQRERELCLASNNLDVYHEIHVVEDMYRRIKSGIEAKGNSQSSTIDEKTLVPPQRRESMGFGAGAGRMSAMSGPGGLAEGVRSKMDELDGARHRFDTDVSRTKSDLEGIRSKVEDLGGISERFNSDVNRTKSDVGGLRDRFDQESSRIRGDIEGTHLRAEHDSHNNNEEYCKACKRPNSDATVVQGEKSRDAGHM